MKPIADESLITRSIDWGVDTIFGLPGDGMNGLFEGLRRHQDRIRFVLVHHEEAAAFMATAHDAYPGRQVIGFVGDGGFAMLMAEVLTTVRHDLPVKIVINNNGAYGQILWEQIALGYPEFGVRHNSYADYAPWAVACGAFGAKVTDPGQLDEAVRAALAHPGPALVDVNVNPDEPLIPGKIEYAQAKGFAEAFLHGQPHKAGIVKTVLEDTLERIKL